MRQDRALLQSLSIYPTHPIGDSTPRSMYNIHTAATMLRAMATAFTAAFRWLRHQVSRLSPWQAVLCAVLCISIGHSLHFSTSTPSTPTAAIWEKAPSVCPAVAQLWSAVAELSSAASAPGAAPVASVVFSNLGPDGVDGSPYSQKK